MCPGIRKNISSFSVVPHHASYIVSYVRRTNSAVLLSHPGLSFRSRFLFGASRSWDKPADQMI